MSTTVSQADWRAFWQRPDASHFVPVYEGTKRLVYTLCRRYLRNDADAQDAFQNTYARLLTAARDEDEQRRLGDVSECGQLLFRLAVREADNLRKRRDRRRQKETPSEKSHLVNAQSAPPDAIVLEAETRAVLERLVDELPEPLRIPLLLHFFHGLSQREIARGLNEAVSTVSDRIRRGIERLEPSTRKAGLSDVGALLAGIAGVSQLLTPTAAAASVFASAEATVAVSAMGAAVSGVGASTSATVASNVAVLGGSVMKLKLAAGVAVLLVLCLGFLAHRLTNSSSSPDRTDPLAATDRPESSPVASSDARQTPESPVPNPPDTVASRTLRIGVRWSDLRRPVPSAEVKVVDQASGDERDATTDDAGLVVVELPPSWNAITMHVEHSAAMPLMHEMRFPNGLADGPKPEEVTLDLDRVVISGYVFDKRTEEPIAEAVVRVENQRRVETLTDEEGFYALAPTIHNLELEAVAEGYVVGRANLTVEPGKVSQRDFLLAPGFSLEILVVDEDDEPISGASVIAERLPGFYSGGDRVKTDVNGRVVVSGMRWDAPQTVKISAEGYVHQYIRKPSGPLEGDLVERKVTLPRWVNQKRVIHGTIQSPDGTPIAGASVQWTDVRTISGDSQGRELVHSNEHGRYRLEFEHNDETCFIGVHADGWAPFLGLKTPAGSVSEPTELDITLRPGVVYSGRVVDEDGEPIVGARLRAAPSRELVMFSHVIAGSARETRSVDGGGFTLEDVGAPTISLRVNASGYTSRELHEEPVGSEAKIVLKEIGVIRGRVLDDVTGEPVPAFNVRFTRGSYIVSRGAPGESFTVPDGRFVLERLDRDVEFDFLVEADGYAPQAVAKVEALPEHRAEEHVVRLSSGSIAGGLVVDAATGQPLSGVAVAYVSGPSLEREPVWTWRMWHEIPGYLREATSDDGRFRFVDTTPPGRLQLLRSGYVPLLIRPEDRVRYSAGDEMRVPLQRAGKLRVRYEAHPALANGSSISLYGADAHGEKLTAEPLGTASPEAVGVSEIEWDFLAPGRYFVEIPAFREKDSDLALPRFRTELVSVAGVETLQLAFGAELGSLTYTGKLPYTADEGHVRNATVAFYPRFAAGFSRLAVLVAPSTDWRFSMPGLSPGSYEVRVTLRHHGAEKNRVLSMPLELTDSRTETLELPKE